MLMFSDFNRRLLLSGIVAFTLLPSALAQADGMVPSTSVVIVNEADGEPTPMPPSH